jgi:hypothetical protein
MRAFIFLWLCLAPLFCWGADAGLPAGRDGAATARQLYRSGRASLEAGKYDEAIRSFDGLISKFPSDPLLPAARKYRAIAVRARRAQAQGASQPQEIPKLVPPTVLPAEKPAQERSGPVKGDPDKCKSWHEGDNHPFCNWYDALAYCEGRLPTVIQLQERNMAECPAGKRGGVCGRRYWSSEGDGDRAKTVIFGNGGEINSDIKSLPRIFVLCAGPAGN